MTGTLFATWGTHFVDRATAAALHLFVQSALLIALGLLAAWLCRRRGAALQSAVLRITLVGVLLCPLVTIGLSAAGVEGFSISWSEAEPRTLAAAGAGDAVDAEVAPAPGSRPPDPPSGARRVEAAEPILPDGGTGFGDAPGSLEDRMAAGPVDLPGTQNTVVEPHSAATVPDRAASAADPIDVAGAPAIGLQLALAALCGVWVLGSLAFCVRLLAAQIVIGRICRRAASAGPPVLALCGTLARRLGVAVPRVLVSEQIPSACLVGAYRPAVLLPSDEAASEEVLTHELAHLVRRDALFLLLSRLACAVLFYQPLVWVLGRRLEQAADEVCDDFVLQCGSDRKTYARTLVEVAEHWQANWSAAAVGLGVVRFRSSLGRRVVRILDSSRSLSVRTGLPRMLFIATIGACLTGTVALIGSEGWGGGASDPSADEPVTTQPDGETKAAAAKSSPTEDPQPGKQDVKDAATRLHYRGQVVRPDGRPAAGARIHFVYYAQPLPAEIKLKPLAVTDADGRFDVALDKSDFDSSGEARTWRYAALIAVADGYGFAWSSSVAHETTGNAVADVNPQFRERFRQMLERERGPIRLVPDDVPLTGTVVTLEGQAVAGARVRVTEVTANKDGDLAAWTRAAREKHADIFTVQQHAGRMMNGPQLAHALPSARTGVDGRFTLRGIGRERIVRLLVSGPRIETREVYARTRPGETIELPLRGRSPELGSETHYPATFTHVAAPSKPIVGTVRDVDTGEPLPGVTVQTYQIAGQRVAGVFQGFIRTGTDGQGRYRLEGAPVGANELIALSPLDQPYLLSTMDADTSARGESLELNFRLKRGLWIEGRVVDAASGQGLPGRVEYFAFSDNPHARNVPGYNGARLEMRYMAGADGRFRVPGLPGRGIVTVVVDDHDKYERGMGADAIEGDDPDFGGPHKTFRAFPRYCDAFSFHALAEVNPPEGVERIEQNFALDSGDTLTGTVVDLDGRPVESGWYTGRTEFETWRLLENGRFTVHSYRPGQARLVQVVSEDRKLAGHVVISGEPPADLVLKLEPAATLKGRVVVDGVPKADCEIIASRPQAAAPGRMQRAADTSRGQLPPDGRRTTGAASTNADGHFEITGLAPGLAYSLDVVERKRMGDLTLHHHEPILEDGVLKPGETKDVGTVPKKRTDLLEPQPGGAAEAGGSARFIPAETEREQDAPKEPESPRSGTAAATGAAVKAEPDGDIVLNGRVLDPQGEPHPNAEVHAGVFGGSGLPWTPLRRTTCDSEGGFRLSVPRSAAIWDGDPVESLAVVATARGYGAGWRGVRLADHDPSQPIELRLTADLPVRGRILNTDGQPVGGATVRVYDVFVPRSENLDEYIGSHPDVSLNSRGAAPQWENSWGGPLPGLADPIVADADGRFEIAGLGAERACRLTVAGSGIHTSRVLVLTRGIEPIPPAESPSGLRSVGPQYPVYGANFEHLGAPGRTIRGIVRDKDTGRPVPGVRVACMQWGGAWQETDAEGRFEFPGCVKGPDYALDIRPLRHPYFAARVRVEDEVGLTPLETTVELVQGIIVSGKVTDKSSGRPLKGTVDYNAVFPNDDAAQFGGGFARPRAMAGVNDDGTFSIVAFPGPGVLGFKAYGNEGEDRYMSALVTSGELAELTGLSEARYNNDDYISIASGPNAQSIIGQRQYQALKLIKPDPDAKSLSVDLRCEIGRTVDGTIVGPDGQPVAGVTVWGLDPRHVFHEETLETASFTVRALNPRRTRRLMFLDRESKLGTALDLPGDHEGPLKVELQPCGSAVGRVVDEDGEPVAGETIVVNFDRLTGPTRWTARTDADGRFRVDGLIPGQGLAVRGGDRGPLFYSFQVDPGETNDLGTKRIER